MEGLCLECRSEARMSIIRCVMTQVCASLPAHAELLLACDTTDHAGMPTRLSSCAQHVGHV